MSNIGNPLQPMRVSTSAEQSDNSYLFDLILVFTGFWQYACVNAWVTEKSVVILGDYCILPKLTGSKRVVELPFSYPNQAARLWTKVSRICRLCLQSGIPFFSYFGQPQWRFSLCPLLPRMHGLAVGRSRIALVP